MKPARLWFAALLSGAIAAVSSCADRTMTGPALEASNFHSSAGLLQCKPLAYDSVTEVIGPPGGVLRVSKHTLSIPGGALTEWVSITAVAPSDTMNRIQFQPEGLVFQTSVDLTMSYANCNLQSSAQPTQIAYTNDSLVILEYMPSTDDVTGKKVTGELTHFSEYAASW